MVISKRLFDLAIALPSLILATPAIGLIALAIYLESPGNPIFSQVRVGRFGRCFRLFKIRTLYSNAQVIPNPEEEIRPGDCRVTIIGRYLRHTKLDELPQLLNVAIGQMSIVGPRPDLPEQVAIYSEEQRCRLAVKPGLTGWAQISGNTWLSWDQRSTIDNYYIKKYSLSTDLRIVWYTLKMLFRGERSDDDPMGVRRDLFIKLESCHHQDGAVKTPKNHSSIQG